jgi:hypothetical protein
MERELMNQYQIASDVRIQMGPKERENALKDHIQRVDELYHVWRDFIKERNIT